MVPPNFLPCCHFLESCFAEKKNCSFFCKSLAVSRIVVAAATVVAAIAVVIVVVAAVIVVTGVVVVVVRVAEKNCEGKTRKKF